LEESAYIGRSVKRVEDRRFLTGRGRYVDDIAIADTAHVVFVRSPYAHARIRAIDCSEALAADGVLAVFTGDDTRHLGQFTPGDAEYKPIVPPQPLLATERVRFVGEPIAALVAISATAAADALELVRVEYDDLDAVTDPLAAMASGAPVLHAEVPGNICLRWAETVGNVDEIFARCVHVVHVTVRTNRVAPAPIEPRGINVQFDVGRNELTVWAATQVPHPLRNGIATITGIPDAQIRVIAPDVGGGFGGKGGLKREEVLVAYFAHRLRRGLRWTSTRSEDFVSTNHGRGVIHEADAAIDGDGRILALKVRSIHSPGAYLAPNGLLPLIRSSQFVSGPYRIEAVQRELVGVLTNTSNMGPNRGTGRPESILLIERVIEAVARLTGLDPLEVRRRNLVQPDQFPYRQPTGVELDSGNYQRTLDLALQLADYAQLRVRQQAARARGELMGIGLSTCVGMTATGMWQSASVRIEPSGSVTVMTGSSPHGQGHETVWAQVAADQLGVPMGSVRVVCGDTALTPYGIGTVGTNGAPLAASAVAIAGRRVRAKVLDIASRLLEVQPDDLTIVDGVVQVVGVPERGVPLQRIARMASGGPGMPEGIELGLDASARFKQASEPFSFGAMIAVTYVDPRSGEVRIERIVFVDDCGVALNPLLLEGQTIGGIAFGLGQILSEEVVYDEYGQPLHASFLGYALPRADWMPPLTLDRTETPSPLNPLGAKGGAEGANIAIPAAIYNSVLDALEPLHVSEVPMPLTPQNIWRAIRAARTSSTSSPGAA
jgi:aerobic carbon-monoxide dehydrogenase large subunit